MAVTVVEQEPLDHDVLPAAAQAAVNDDSVCICQMTHKLSLARLMDHYCFARCRLSAHGLLNDRCYH